MYAYEMHLLRQADLLRAADHQRLVRAAREARRTARRTPGDESGGRVSGPNGPDRSRFTRAA